MASKERTPVENTPEANRRFTRRMLIASSAVGLVAVSTVAAGVTAGKHYIDKAFVGSDRSAAREAIAMHRFDDCKVDTFTDTQTRRKIDGKGHLVLSLSLKNNKAAARYLHEYAQHPDIVKVADPVLKAIPAMPHQPAQGFARLGSPMVGGHLDIKPDGHATANLYPNTRMDAVGMKIGLFLQNEATSSSPAGQATTVGDEYCATLSLTQDSDGHKVWQLLPEDALPYNDFRSFGFTPAEPETPPLYNTADPSTS